MWLSIVRAMVSPRHLARTQEAGWRAAALPTGECAWVWAAGPYSGDLGEAIRRAKYGQDWVSVQTLRCHMKRVHHSGVWTLHPTLVPIPADPKRLGRRGLHLPALLAQSLSRNRGLPLDRLGLLKHQTSDSLAQHRADPSAPLRARPHFEANQRLQGCPVVLIDDVLTSGLTLEVAFGALRAVGAHPVGAVVLAHQRAAERSRTMMAPCTLPNPSAFMSFWSSLKFRRTREM